MNDLIIRGDVGGEGELHIPTEQDQLDAIKSALSKLPSEELNRLGIDLGQEFLIGTSNGDLLKQVWNIRQSEVKRAVEGQLKPAEFMRDIMNILQNTTEASILIQNLVVLESLLADVDNSRDFHTIGGWPILLGLLHRKNPIDIRSHTAWCIGTAVKNDYDYQLWIFEEIHLPDSSPQSGIELLLENLEVSVGFLTSPVGSDEGTNTETTQASVDLTKRVLYALASCLRGNMDVQETLMALTRTLDEQRSSSSDFPTLLFRLSSHLLDLSRSQPKVLSDQNHLAILRKVWSLVSDMMDELNYLREGLLSEMILSRQHESGASLEAQIKEATQAIHPLGEFFLLKADGMMGENWLKLSRSMLLELTRGCVTQSASLESIETGDSRPVLSPTPSSFNSDLRVSESCSIIHSPPHRAVYESVVNSHRHIRRYSAPLDSGDEDKEITARVQALSAHPSFRETS
jgi:hypothetical protein